MKPNQPRWIYMAVALSVTLPFLAKIKMTMPISEPVQKAFDVVEKLAEENEGRERKKLALLVADWEPATMAEIHPQVLALIHHFMSRQIPFAILGFRPTGPGLAQDLAHSAAREWNAEYGVAWCNWGYKTQMDTTIQAMLTSFHTVIREDTQGTPIQDLPMMVGFKDMGDIGLVAEFTGSSGLLQPWVEFVHAELRTPILHGCTGVMESPVYPMLSSGQIQGFMGGLSGAAQYEQLVGKLGKGSEGMAAQSLAHLLVLGLILAANLKEFAAWAAKGTLWKR